jgi:hypothetical protein
MVSPVVVGTSQVPLPGVYFDSTLLRGNRVSVAVLNPTTHQFQKPLRYSMQIPLGCLQVNPIQTDQRVESFTIQLFCKYDRFTEFDLIEPSR